MKKVKRKRPSWFIRAAKAASRATSRPATFAIAVTAIVLWAFTGPIFDYSDTRQLVINTGTTIITFLMVFLIQNTQNRDTEVLQIKLDELLRSMENAHTVLLDAVYLSCCPATTSRRADLKQKIPETKVSGIFDQSQSIS